MKNDFEGKEIDIRLKQKLIVKDIRNVDLRVEIEFENNESKVYTLTGKSL